MCGRGSSARLYLPYPPMGGHAPGPGARPGTRSGWDPALVAAMRTTVAISVLAGGRSKTASEADLRRAPREQREATGGA
jgi:hypothetical protein